MKTNQQKEKQSNDTESFFLDTNIIIGRVFESERNHLKCKQLLTSQNIKYTSESVKKEALALLRRRKNYYKEFLVLKYNLKNTKNKVERKRMINELIDKIAIYESDYYFLKRSVEYILNKYWTKGGLEYYRTFMYHREKEFIKCFDDEIDIPIIKKSTNHRVINSVNVIINNRNDSQILVDMIQEFINANEEINFTTMDKKDLLEKYQEIQIWFKGYFDRACFFEIIGISEAFKKLVH